MCGLYLNNYKFTCEVDGNQKGLCLKFTENFLISLCSLNFDNCLKTQQLIPSI